MKAEAMQIKGFARMQMIDQKSGKIMGDSGWQKNTVVNLGFQDYIIGAVGGLGGSKQVTHMAIGTGGAPVATDTALAGETGQRVTTSNSVISSKTLQATAQFSGTSMGSTCTIQNVALVNTSSGGTILAGTTYATSQWALIGLWCRRMVTSLLVLFKVGGHLVIETIPSQVSTVVNSMLKGVETGRKALLAVILGVEGTVRTVWRHAEQSRNAFASVKLSNSIANQNVARLRSIAVMLFGKLREFGGTLKNIFETIPSRASKFAKNFVEGVETMYEAPAFAG